MLLHGLQDLFYIDVRDSPFVSKFAAAGARWRTFLARPDGPSRFTASVMTAGQYWSHDGVQVIHEEREP
jgi:hypothetical protein